MKRLKKFEFSRQKFDLTRLNCAFLVRNSNYIIVLYLVIWQVFIKILFLDKIELLPQCGKVVCPRHVLQLYGKIKTSR